MAIKLTLKKTERILFCGSKWWGDPDMPENMQYPVMEVTEDGETYDYPLTFVCQINCEDIAKFDNDGRLPHEGMLYFFAAMDDYIGAVSKVMTKNEIKRLKILMKNELDVDKKMKIAMQIAELKKEDV